MTDRPIIFSAPMIHALREGRKTQTRRLAWKRIKRGPSPEGALLHTQWNRAAAGDRLWVRETWYETPAGTVYRADGATVDGPARSPRHMRRADSRLTLILTAMRLEQLQSISPEDVAAEGLWRGRARTHLFWRSAGACRVHEGRSHRAVFAEVWDEVNGAGAWDANPEVIVLTFEVAPRNIDAA